ncbi:MAG: endo alpha-1,4 polygalactosaminidase, partial [Pseudoruegeria sp.]
MTIPFLYQLQNADYASLSDADFRVAVIDPDDSALSAQQVADLQSSQNKLLYAYTSIGEAESYRDYWEDSWTIQPPDYVLGENVQWEGNFRVEFWDTDWQEIIFARVDDVLAKGYDGIYLDIVDGYSVDEVIAAY